MKTSIKTIAAAVIALVAFSQPARAQMPGFDMSGEVGQYISQALPPVIGVVDFEPKAPAPGEEVTVSASIFMIQLGGEALTSVSQASLFYTVDGGASWEEVDMDQDGDKEELWTAVIPEQETGTTVEFYVKAVSDVGSIDFEAGGRQFSLNVGQSQAIEIIPAMNLAGYDPENADDSPLEHLALIAEDPEDDNAAKAADFREIRFGADTENYYFLVKLADKMDGGTMSPLLARAYLSALLNLNRNFPDFDAREGNFGDYAKKIARLFPTQDQEAMGKQFFRRLSIWFWAPLAEAIPMYKVPKTGIIRMNLNTMSSPDFDTQGATSEVLDDGTLKLTLKRASLGDDTDMFMFLLLDIEIMGNLADYKNLQFNSPDICYPTLLKFADHKYTVGE